MQLVHYFLPKKVLIPSLWHGTGMDIFVQLTYVFKFNIRTINLKL